MLKQNACIQYGEAGQQEDLRSDGKRLAVLVEGRVISAPFLSGSIYDKAVITGEITKVEAERIASELNRASRKKH
jgi:preprotein translocase subunit SecD